MALSKGKACVTLDQPRRHRGGDDSARRSSVVYIARRHGAESGASRAGVNALPAEPLENLREVRAARSARVAVARLEPARTVRGDVGKPVGQLRVAPELPQQPFDAIPAPASTLLTLDAQHVELA